MHACHSNPPSTARNALQLCSWPICILIAVSSWVLGLRSGCGRDRLLTHSNAIWCWPSGESHYEDRPFGHTHTQPRKSPGSFRTSQWCHFLQSDVSWGQTTTDQERMNVFRFNTTTRVITMWPVIEQNYGFYFYFFGHAYTYALECMFLYLSESHLEVGGIIDGHNEICVQTRQ